MKNTQTILERSVNRPGSFIKNRAMAAGNATVGAGAVEPRSDCATPRNSPARAAVSPRGMPPFSRFLAAKARIHRERPVAQYAELGGVQDNEVDLASQLIPGCPATVTGGNPVYGGSGPTRLGHVPGTFMTTPRGELSRGTFINAYLASKGAGAPASTSSAPCPAKQGDGRQPDCTVLQISSQLTVDTSWWSRYRNRTGNLIWETRSGRPCRASPWDSTSGGFPAPTRTWATSRSPGHRQHGRLPLRLH